MGNSRSSVMLTSDVFWSPGAGFIGSQVYARLLESGEELYSGATTCIMSPFPSRFVAISDSLTVLGSA
jgi:hypothetical protein